LARISFTARNQPARPMHPSHRHNICSLQTSHRRPRRDPRLYHSRHQHRIHLSSTPPLRAHLPHVGSRRARGSLFQPPPPSTTMPMCRLQSAQYSGRFQIATANRNPSLFLPCRDPPLRADRVLLLPATKGPCSANRKAPVCANAMQLHPINIKQVKRKQKTHIFNKRCYTTD